MDVSLGEMIVNALIFCELSTLYTAKGSGPDDLHPFMLQILADFLAKPITTVYKKSPEWRGPPGLAQGNHLPDFQKGGPGGRGQLALCEFNFCFA